MVRMADIMRKARGEGLSRKPVGEGMPDAAMPVPALTQKLSPRQESRGKVEPRTRLEEVSGEYDRAAEFMRARLAEARVGRPLDADAVKRSVRSLLRALDHDADAMVASVMGPCARDYLPCHSVNVAVLSLNIGLAIGWSESKLLELGVAALLHDVGMAQLPRNVVSKEGKLTMRELALVRQHPEKGAEFLARTEGISEGAARAVAEEHERVDGKGYPKGLEGGSIHEYARIVAVVDTYEALTHRRIYRKPYVPYEALRMLVEAGRSMLDPEIVKVLVEELSLYPLGSLVKLNTDEMARVVHANKGSIMRPVVEVVRDASGEPLPKPRRMDLLKHPMVHISEVVAEEAYEE